MIEEIIKNIGLNKDLGGVAIKEVPKAWGREIWIINTDLYCGKILEMNKGYSFSKQIHPVKDETLLLYKGEIIMQYNEVTWKMKPGNIQRVKPGDKHKVTALEYSIIIEFSTHHGDKDVIRLENSKEVDLETLNNLRNLY